MFESPQAPAAPSYYLPLYNFNDGAQDDIFEDSIFYLCLMNRVEIPVWHYLTVNQFRP
jgi:hypothetical protein